jgi:hypothetical protein
MLDLQDENGFWEGRPGFATMDAVYLLSHLAKAIQWRERDVPTVMGGAVTVSPGLIFTSTIYLNRSTINPLRRSPTGNLPQDHATGLFWSIE